MKKRRVKTKTMKMKKYKLIPKENSKLSESELGTIDMEEKFKGPKDAIKWCNDKFRELKDIKYKQIANYLHIYL